MKLLLAIAINHAVHPRVACGAKLDRSGVPELTVDEALDSVPEPPRSALGSHVHLLRQSQQQHLTGMICTLLAFRDLPVSCTRSNMIAELSCRLIACRRASTSHAVACMARALAGSAGPMSHMIKRLARRCCHQVSGAANLVNPSDLTVTPQLHMLQTATAKQPAGQVAFHEGSIRYTG
jgi:hypothetical protein